MSRPLIAIPARFSTSASALRFAAEVNARKLIDAVYEAGGEPLTVHPSADCPTSVEVGERLAFADAVLLPGGADINPARYGGEHHESVYDVDDVQDTFDLAVARWALQTGRPLLAICRGVQIVNVALGGTLRTHMTTPHRHVVSELVLAAGTRVHSAVRTSVLKISCFHHQELRELGAGLRATARAADGTIEAVETAAEGPGWFLGVQWHPEDTADTDPHQARLFDEFVHAAAGVEQSGRACRTDGDRRQREETGRRARP